MTAEGIKLGLLRLGWPLEPTDLVRFYFTAHRVAGLKEKNLQKWPDRRPFYYYLATIKQTPAMGFKDGSVFPLIEQDWQADLFDELTEAVICQPFPEYVRNLLPGRVKDQKIFSELEKKYDKILYQCYCFYLLLRVSPELPLETAYERYLQLFSGKAFLTDKEFSRMFCLMNWSEIRNDTSTKAAAKEANRLLTGLFFSNQKKCEIVAEILQRLDRLKSKDVQAPAAYLSKILYGDSKEYKNVNADGTIDLIIKQLSKQVSFLDFLAVLLSEGTRDENLAEFGFLLPWFQQELTDQNRPTICFVNAVPAFFSAWSLSLKDSVVVPFNTAIKPVSEAVDTMVYGINELESIPYAEDQRVLYFARGYRKEEALRHLHALCRNDAVVYAVIPDVYKDITVGIPGYAVDQVTILPTELFKGDRSKYYVARIVPGNHELIEALTVQTETIDRRIYLAPCHQWAKADIAWEDYNSNTTLRALFQQAAASSDSTSKRNRPNEYSFSPELTLWYLTKRKDNGLFEICLYLCEIPSEQQRKRNKFPRGKKIKSTETWNTGIPEDQLKEWIETKGAYNAKLREPAIRQIELYNNKKMSLKSIWYCLRDRISFSAEEAGLVQRFARSEQGAKLIIGKASEEEIKTAIEQAGERAEELASLLDTLFEMALKRKYIKTHPFEELHEARKKQKRREESVRALAKRSYTEAEEESIWDYYQNNSDNPGALGMILCFFTGLTPPYVAALAWRDWRAIKNTGHKQLVINKKLRPDGEIEWQMDEENCRLIPIMDRVSGILASWEEKTKPTPDNMIVAAENRLSAIRDHIRKAEKYAGIEQDFISLPNAEKRMDMNQYGGSRMHVNFERRCYTDCGMTDAEVHHLTLQKMPDTLSKNYVDFGHECIQERMAVKLNQWGLRFEKTNDSWSVKKLSKQKIILSAHGKQTESYHLSAGTAEPIRVITECDHDFEYRFLVRSEED